MPVSLPVLALRLDPIVAFILVSNFARPVFDTVRVHAQTAGVQ
jgi:hypothetical protein